MSTTTASRPDAGIQLRPFRHRVIDDWTDAELVRAADAEWPDERWPFWHRYENGKLATKDPLRYPPACAEIVRRMLCLPIAELLGVDEAFGDWTCHAAGLHAKPPGSSLGVHLGSDHHPITGWQRAANAVLYVNRQWDEEWGGEFELWDSRGRRSVRPVEPRFNRLVLFEPSDAAWHAVAPVRGEVTRKTLTVFFWKHAGLGRAARGQARFAGGCCSHGDAA